MAKTTYSIEHVQISVSDAMKMTNDLTKQGNAPIVGFHVQTQCPSCEHWTNNLFPLLNIVEGAGSIKIAPPKDFVVGPPPEREVADLKVAAIHCQCPVQHLKSEGAFGCGSSWLIGMDLNITADSDAPSHSPTMLALTEKEESKWWPAAEGVASAVPTSLTAVRAAGTTWQTGLTAILAIAGVGTVTGGRSTLHGINGWSESFVLVLAGLALLGTAAAAGIALWATVGFPVAKQVSSVHSLETADLQPLRDSLLTAKRLRMATWLTLGAFIASFIAVMIFLVTPDNKAATPAKSLVGSSLSRRQPVHPAGVSEAV